MTLSATPSETATGCFEQAFNQDPSGVWIAPGRVNLIGEHTDYNDGFVFPVAINFHTAVAGATRPDRTIDVIAHDEGNQRVQFDIDAEPQFDEVASWSNYVRGTVAELRKAGYELSGASLAISGNVPLGAGLSSSAALEMSIIAALTGLSGEAINAVTAAKLGQAAENNFVGCQCGIMDQLISAAGRTGAAVMLDCRTLELQSAPIPGELTIVVINSNLRRALVDGEYNTRREQCESAARHFNLPALRDLSLDILSEQASELHPSVFRRARHVVTENQRTLDMVDALKASDMQRISSLMADSHASMRDDFEITTPEIDGLVDIVKTVVGDRGGVRMTGGGFGGCVVALLPQDLVGAALDGVTRHYPAIAGHQATSMICQASAGAFVNPDS